MELNPLFANVLAWILIAGGLALAVWWVIGLHAVRTREEKELREADLPGYDHEPVPSVPPVMIIFYVFMALSCMGYVLFVWLGGIRY
jgi:hypothetical protein